MTSPFWTGYHVVAQAIDPLSLEHQEPVLHHVNLDQGQRRPGPKREHVDGEVKPRVARQEDLEDRVGITHERRRPAHPATSPQNESGAAYPGRAAYRFSNTLRRDGTVARTCDAASGAAVGKPAGPARCAPPHPAPSR